MPATTKHSVTYDSGLFLNGVATGVDMELVSSGSGLNNINSILITNTHGSAAVTVSLFIQDTPTEAASSIFYIIKNVSIPTGSSLLLSDEFIPMFSNDIFGLHLTVGSTDTLDLFIS